MPQQLKAFAVAETRRIEEMRSVLFDVYDVSHFDLHGDRNKFFAQASYFPFGASSLSHCSYESPVRIDFRDDDYVRFQICTSGSGRTSVGSNAVEVGTQQIVCSPADAALEFGPSLEQFALRVDRADFENDLAILLGTRPKNPLSFDALASCDTGRTRRFREKILHTAHSIDFTDEPIPVPLLREMDQSIRVAALYGMPNNFSDLLYGAAQTVAPWQVKRVEDWIDANWMTSVTIEKLAEVSGASIRSIFATFKSARGYTPMEYLKTVRLNAARDMLREARPNASITAIAFACAFSNPGHFARDFRQQFGELPSETLRSRRLTAA